MTLAGNVYAETVNGEVAVSDVGIEAEFANKLDVLDLKNMDILDVFKIISQKSGLNIIAGQNVKGRVNVFLKDIDVEDALRIIVDAYDWAYIKENDVFKVMTKKKFEDIYGYQFGQDIKTKTVNLKNGRMDEIVKMLNQIKSNNGKILADAQSGVVILMDEAHKIDEMMNIVNEVDVAVKTQIFELSHIKASDLEGKINELLTPLVGTLRSDDRSNKMIVSDTQHKLNMISQVVSEFDQREREVLIEAKIIQIVLNDEFKMGVNWEAVVSNFHNLNLTSNFDVLNQTSKAGRLSIGTLASDNYSAIVEALDIVGTTNILSNPRIAVINNEEAKILVGSTEPYVTTTTTTPSSGPTTTAESINFIEVGVKLYVTPTIHKDDFITMKIKPEVSSVVSTIVTSNNNTIPVVETSEAETTVMVKDGVTIIIGGLIKEEKIETTKQIPLLGKVPVLGAVFRNRDQTASKTEIVILLTPQVITGDISQNAF